MHWQHSAEHRETLRPTPSDLIGIATRWSVQTCERRLPEGFLGTYDHRRRLITLTKGLTPVERRSVMAHELGHARYGHDGSTARYERAAQRYAAELLIDPAKLREVCAWATDDHQIAEALDVTVDIVEAYRALV